MTPPPSPVGTIAGSVMPIRRAEELIATLQGVLSVRIVSSDTGGIEEVHVLTTDAVLPKQTVRNIESALMAQLGLRVNHRKISIATTLDTRRATDVAPPQSDDGSHTPHVAPLMQPAPAASTPSPFAPLSSSPTSPSHAAPSPSYAGAFAPAPIADAAPVSSRATRSGASPRRDSSIAALGIERRTLIFEDVETRRSRGKGVLCRVTLARDGEEFIGEAEGQETARSRVELAARATLLAIGNAMKSSDGAERSLALEGSKSIDAFERVFIFVRVAARIGRESVALTGSCEVLESAETSAVLAVLDATNRWMCLDR